jgi:peptide deformylase
MLKIITFPDPILREKMPEFDFAKPSHDPVQLEKDLIEAMFTNNGMGLSANQTGIRARVFVMGHKNDPSSAQAFFNPQVVANVNDVDDLEEGCLSFPGIYVKVKRPRKIKVRWQNSQGEYKEAELDGYSCKCFLHELDHLEGIVFKDRVSDLKWTNSVKKSFKYNKRNI